MKHFLLTLFVALCSINIAAQGSGSACNDAIFVDTTYSAALAAGDYWFTANTPALPLTIYVYPEDTTALAPLVELDLTCTPGVYDDEKIANMLQFASKYGLSFPMKDTLKQAVDSYGDTYYYITYDRNYRDMLYEQGVTYSIPAFVHLFLSCDAEVTIASTSINTQCRKHVNAWGFNTALRLAPIDSTNVYIWPIGEWIDKKYQITWESEGSLTMVDGTTCIVAKGQYVRNQYVLPNNKIIMNTATTSKWINDIYQTELYTRVYPQKEGILKIQEIVEKAGLETFVVAGVSAVIDNEALTITATLPAGTNRTTALKEALVVTFMGDTLVYGTDWKSSTQRFLDLIYSGTTYSLRGITVTKETGSTDATLKQIYVDGYSLDGFSSSIATYNDVETDAIAPIITVVATDSTAKVEITQATAVPGVATITVTAEAGNTQVYTLNLIKGRSRNTNLKEILVDGKPVPGFSPTEKYYRMEVLTLPVVEATAEDSLSTIQILQAKQVPGYAQISVTAEAGNVETYSINFSPDQSIARCFASSDSIDVDTPVSLTVGDNTVLRFPVEKWMEEYLQFTWTGKQPLCVYVSPTCEFDITQDYYVLDSFRLAIPKGQEKYVYNLRPADFTRLANLSVDGNLYIKFRHTEAGEVSLKPWVETCVTRGLLIEPGDEVTLAGNSHTTIYKLYISEFKDKDMRLIWQGNDKLTSYFAETCDFNLTSTNRHVLKPSPFNFSAGKDSIDVNTATWTNWAASEDEGFIYVRFVNKQTGTLTFKVLKDYNPQSPTGVENAWSPLADNLRVVAEQGSLLIRSFVAQPVGVYTLDGMCVAQLTMQADEQIALTLPAGLYIVRGDTAALKAVVR